YRPPGAVDHRPEIEEQTLASPVIEVLVIDDHCGFAVERAAKHLLAGMSVFLQVPMQHRAEFSAIVAEGAPVSAMTLVNPKMPGVGVVADMARLDDNEILTVMRIGAVAVDRDLAADPAMIEREGAKMLRDQDDGIALAFVGAEGARRHHALTRKAERSA